jgi:hypothetical protein
LVLTVGIVYALGIAFFDPIWIDYYSLTKVLKENRSSASRFQVYWRWGKLAPFFVFQHCVQFGLIRVRVKTLLSMKSTEQNHSIDVLITRLFSILFWFNPVIWFYQKAILQNLEFIADSEALLKISESLSNHALKITAHENCVALSNHFINH